MGVSFTGAFNALFKASGAREFETYGSGFRVGV